MGASFQKPERRVEASAKDDVEAQRNETPPVVLGTDQNVSNPTSKPQEPRDPLEAFAAQRPQMTPTTMRNLCLLIMGDIRTNAPDDAKPSLEVLATVIIPHIQGLVIDPRDAFHLHSAQLLQTALEAALADNAITGYERTSDPVMVTTSVRAFTMTAVVALSTDPVSHPICNDLLSIGVLDSVISLPPENGRARLSELISEMKF